MSDESIKPPSTSNKMLNLSVNYVVTKVRVKFNGDCLKQEKISFNHGKIINIYVVYEIETLFMNFGKSYKKASSRLRLLEQMRFYLTSKAARLVYITMIIPLITSSCTLKLSYNNT